MSKNKVTEEQINAIMEASEIKAETQFEKVTVVTCKLPNGFVIVEASGAVDKKNYSFSLGKEICLNKIKDKIWAFEGYKLASEMLMRASVKCVEDECGEENVSRKNMNFGQALDALRRGWPLRREGWNGKGIFIKLQAPDQFSKMTQPYIYIETMGLISENEKAPRGRVPWMASQTDMLATDWEIVE